MKRFNNSAASKTQFGFVAIFSTLVIMGILTLLTVGFTYSTRQAQRRALDDQLNTQAFYAAESAINEARAALASDPNIEKTTCRTTGDGFNYDIDTTLGIRYSCLMIDSSPPGIKYDNVPVAGSSEPIFSQAIFTDNPELIRFSWDSTDPTAGLSNRSYSDAASPPVLSSASEWGNNVGVLRIDLIPLTTLDRSSLTTNSYTFFAYPNSAGGAGTINVLPGPLDQAGTLSVQCNPSGVYRCVGSVRPRIGGSAAPHTSYMIRLQAYYNPVKVYMEFWPNTAGTGAPLEVRGGQAQIDATGEASGVFRRVQIWDTLASNYGWHEASALVTADSICKRIVGAPPAGDGSGGSRVVMPVAAPTDPACDVFN